MGEKSSPTPVVAFRRELKRLMPGYQWTVHRSHCVETAALAATGTHSSGFNRLSTLSVVRFVRLADGSVEYAVKSSGYGASAPWLHEFIAPTLARALRGLQLHYEHMAAKYGSHASDLSRGRRQADQMQES